MRKVLVLVACLVFLMAGAAQAAYLQLENWTTVTDYTEVTIHDPAMGPTVTQGSVAGRFIVDFGPSKTDYTRYQAFCVDPATVGWTTWYDNYTMIAVPDQDPYKQAAYIYDRFGSLNASAAQIAIWEIVFEKKSGGTVGNLTSADKFYGTNFNDADLTDAAYYIAQAELYGASFNASGYRLLVSSVSGGAYYGDPWQDWIVRVPEPGVLTLLGLGLVALGITRRRTM